MKQSGSELERKNSIPLPPASTTHDRLGYRLQRMWLRIPWIAVLGGGIFCVALAFNLFRLDKPSIWFDEAFSVELAQQPLPRLWQIIFGPEPNMELYYLFLHFWLKLTNLLGFHPTEAVVRFPSAVFAAASTVVVFLIGQRYLTSYPIFNREHKQESSTPLQSSPVSNIFLNRETILTAFSRFIGSMLPGLVAATLYLLNDLQLVYAQQTRSYSLQLFLNALSWYLLLKVLRSEDRQLRWWIAYVVVTALTIYTHLFSLFIILSQFIAVIGLLLLPGPWRTGVRGRFKALTLSLVALGVLILPMLIVSRQGAKTGWLPIPHLNDLLYLFRTIGGDSQRYIQIFTLCCLLSVMVILLAYLFQNLRGKRRVMPDWLANNLKFWQNLLPVAWIFACWLVIPIVVSYVLSHGSMRLFSSRYLVAIVPPLFLLVGLSVTVLRWRVVQLALAGVLIFQALSVVPVYYRSAQVEDWNSVSHWVIDHYRAGDGLVCYHNGEQQGCQISVDYYLHAYPSAAHFSSDSPGIFSWEKFAPTNPGPDAAVDPAVLEQYGAKYSRIFFIVGRLPDDAAATKEKVAQQWLDSHYQLSDQFLMTTVTVRLYTTHPSKP